MEKHEGSPLVQKASYRSSDNFGKKSTNYITIDIDSMQQGDRLEEPIEQLHVEESSSGSSDNSDTESTNPVPMNGKSIQNPMAKIYFEGENAFDKSALVIYTHTTRPHGTAWDNSSQFMHATDEAFFKRNPSRKVLGAGTIGALLGVVFPGTPLTGSILWSIGNALRIPIAGGISDALVSEIMITMSPVFARQFYTRAQAMMRWLAGEELFSVTQEGSNKPHVYNPGVWHTAAKFLVGFGAAVEGAFYWGVAYAAEGEKYQSISLGMGWGLAFALAERYYTVGIRRLDDVFVRYGNDSHVIYQQRRILIEQSKRALSAVKENPDFLKEVYSICNNARGKGDSDLDKIPTHYFALSSLFLRHITSTGCDTPRANQNLLPKQTNLMEEMEKAETEIWQSKTFKILADRLTPSAKEDFMEYMSIFLTGFGTFSRLLGKQYILDLILQNALSLDPTVSATTAWCLAGFDVVVRSILEYDVQKDSMKSWLNLFSSRHLVDCQFLRKCMGGFSFGNGGLVALAGTVATLKKFEEMSVPLPLQVFTIIPAFILDQGAITQYADENTNEIITGAVTGFTILGEKWGRGKESVTMLEKQAWCHYWIDNMIRFLKVADTDTIGMLFHKTQRAT